ncbi:CHAD domain-containing protein [Terrabacter sp. Ter38]|uniref:CHAD domain-containing protein n=1 Tax=Terrabacter sp. Ter38 TaxID=2926030 RepID=UPI0021176A07|nr:CHAD domain-containing protein [Terrabacter sp. Ter38]
MRMPSAASLLSEHLREQREAFATAEAAVRAGEPEGVHDLRVAMRRIRSALASFHALVDPAVTEPLRDELRWAAGRLGEARDAEVVQDLVDTLLDDIGPAGLIGLDEAVTGLRARLHLDATAADEVIDETLGSSRYAAAIALLDSVVTHPPLTDGAERGAKKVVRRVLRKEGKRVRERADLAEDALATGDTELRSACLHDVRKAAKRLRYAAEAMAPVSGSRVGLVAERAADVQGLLGDHHDAVVTRATLRHLAIDEDAGVAAAFLLGHLDSDEQRAADRLERRGGKALRRLDRAIDRALA